MTPKNRPGKMRGPAIRTLMKYPFVVVVLDNWDNVIDWDSCAKRETIGVLVNWLKNQHPGKKIRVYEWLLTGEIDGTD